MFFFNVPMFKKMGRILPNRLAGRLLSTWFFFVLCTGYSTLYGNSTFSYSELLRQAREELNRLRYDEALQKLEIADSLGTPRTSVYFEIEGRVWIGKGDLTTGLESFEKSIALDPDHSSLMNEIFAGYEELRKPTKAYQFARLSLSKNPENPTLRYKVLVLSSRLGNLEYYKETLNWIRKNNPYREDLSAIESEVNASHESGKIDETISKCRKFLPYFPDNVFLHRILLLSLKKKKVSNLEQSLLDRAAIFRNEPIFAYESALEFLQNRRFNDSLAMSRRAFYLGLKKNGSSEKEILYPLHRIYRQKGSATDIQAIEILQEIAESGRKIDVEFLDAKLKQTGFNRELLLFSLFYLQKHPEKNSDLKAEEWKSTFAKIRKRQEEDDLAGIVSPFSYDPEESSFLSEK
ncbi:tetratricopeptide repeat protein [Leptospira alstonii]|nr:tetratricopeptide repeat protein [Leptospira alstonii]